MPWRRSLVFVALATLLGCASDAPTAPPNIVVIVLDTARPDLLSAYGHPRPTSPFLESFAASGARFDRAYSSSSWTLPAHGSLFTGLPPDVHQANQTSRRVAESIPQLQQQLSEAGFQTAGFSGNMWVSELGGFEAGFDHFENLNQGVYRPRVQKLAADRDGARTPPEAHYIASRVRRWLEADRDAARPFFLFVNLVEPHLPYLPHWDAARHFVPSKDARWNAIEKFYSGAKTRPYLVRHYGRERPLSTDEWDAVTAMYEGALRAVDEVSGAIVSAVDAVSDPDNTLVFIISDHGENLGDHGHATHIFNLFDTNLKIVCLVRGPGFEPGAVEDALVHITDIHATALHAAGVTPLPDTVGIDLRGAIPDTRTISATLEYPSVSLGLFPKRVSRTGVLDDYKVELRAAVGPRYKLIRRVGPNGELVGEDVYDLVDDPHESQPLAPESVDAEALARLRQAIRGPASGAEAPPLHELDEDVLDDLRALGYVP